MIYIMGVVKNKPLRAALLLFKDTCNIQSDLATCTMSNSFMDSEDDFETPAKKYRFGDPADEKTLADYSKAYVPHNTAITNVWSKLRYFQRMD